MAQHQKRLRRAAVQPAGDVVFPAVVGDVGCALGVAVVGIKRRLFIPEARLLHEQQIFTLLGPGQKFLRCNGLFAGKIRIKEKEIIHPPQRVLLRQKDGEPLQCAVRPGVGLLVNAVYAGRVLILNGRGIRKDKVFLLAPGQELFLKAAVKLRPEHRVLAGTDVQHPDFCHAASPFRFSLRSTFAPYWRR